MEFPTWSEIDAELDLIEKGDIFGLVAVFQTYRSKLLVVDGKKSRVNVSSFSQHIGMPRHAFSSWLRTVESQQQKTA